MVIHPWAWGILALVAIGLVAFYVGLAALFGVGIWLTNGGLYAQEFYAG